MHQCSDTTITIVSKSGLFRNGLRSLLNKSSFSVVDEFQSIEQIDADGAGIVLLDAGLNPLERLEDIRDLSLSGPSVSVVVLADTLEWRSLVAVLDAGVDGYLLKDISMDALIGSLQLVELGEKVFPTDMSALLLRGTAPALATANDRNFLPNLSTRENEILRYLVDGESNKMIARHLEVTEATVKVHMKSLMRKLKCNNRTQAAIWAVNQRLYDIQPGTPAEDENRACDTDDDSVDVYRSAGMHARDGSY